MTTQTEPRKRGRPRQTDKLPPYLPAPITPQGPSATLTRVPTIRLVSRYFFLNRSALWQLGDPRFIAAIQDGAWIIFKATQQDDPNGARISLAGTFAMRPLVDFFAPKETIQLHTRAGGLAAHINTLKVTS